jgi:hypothetical protein
MKRKPGAKHAAARTRRVCTRPVHVAHRHPKRMKSRATAISRLLSCSFRPFRLRFQDQADSGPILVIVWMSQALSGRHTRSRPAHLLWNTALSRSFCAPVLSVLDLLYPRRTRAGPASGITDDRLPALPFAPPRSLQLGLLTCSPRCT